MRLETFAILLLTFSTLICRFGAQIFYLEKIRVFQAGLCPDTLAWNNRIGL